MGQEIWAIIPVKPLLMSKSRLAQVLSVAARAELMCGFLTRMLAELQQVSELAQILLVSSDPTVAAIARRFGVLLLAEERPWGLNTAVTQAAHLAAAHGAAGILILPADLPFLTAGDVRQLLAQRTGDVPMLVICSDDRGSGTNALFLSPPDTFTFQYGPGSFQKHLHEGDRWGMACQAVQCPGLQFDLDTENDWQIYQQARLKVSGIAEFH
ncbi:MAG: 2-phospho-L-lactate guanylyltransferase [Chloroflexi bacterium]|nr:2-phospho-L-lactate guanylyltransferase [Chloroflexota bacterium]MBP7043294.1 2-phospho-L-lactate guanylyltransferase [Chloroflexota bacterium]